MSDFNRLFEQLMNENNVSGGVGSVFSPNGSVNDGAYGNQFPSQNDNAYAPGDARMPWFLGASKKKKKKIKVQRRSKSS